MGNPEASHFPTTDHGQSWTTGTFDDTRVTGGAGSEGRRIEQENVHNEGVSHPELPSFASTHRMAGREPWSRRQVTVKISAGNDNQLDI